MHELMLAESALALALREAQQAGAARVTAMHFRIGAMSGVVPEALVFALSTIMEGTPAAGAQLDWQPVAAGAHCAFCATEYDVVDFCYACPVCGTENRRLARGQELELISVEVDGCAKTAAAVT
jgi:hydrogenase nickel incorporation protein HypA/HybF